MVKEPKSHLSCRGSRHVACLRSTHTEAGGTPSLSPARSRDGHFSRGPPEERAPASKGPGAARDSGNRWSRSSARALCARSIFRKDTLLLPLGQVYPFALLRGPKNDPSRMGLTSQLFLFIALGNFSPDGKGGTKYSLTKKIAFSFIFV